MINCHYFIHHSSQINVMLELEYSILHSLQCFVSLCQYNLSLLDSEPIMLSCLHHQHPFSFQQFQIIVHVKTLNYLVVTLLHVTLQPDVSHEQDHECSLPQLQWMCLLLYHGNDC